MNKKLFRRMFIGIIGIQLFLPSIVCADEGVVVKDFQLKDDQGKVLRTFKQEEQVTITDEDKDSYEIDLGLMERKISKDHILKTKKLLNENLYAKNDNVWLRVKPSVFSHYVTVLKKGEFLKEDPAKSVKEWKYVMTSNGLSGWVQEDEVVSKGEETTVYTTGYIKKEFIKDENYFYYGKPVEVYQFQDHQFLIQLGKTSYQIPQTDLSLAKLKSASFVSPIGQDIQYFSSFFGWRKDPITGSKRFHSGVDIPVLIGTPVYAMKGGIVETAVNNQRFSHISYGNFVKINHGNGVETLYGHMNQVLVKQNQKVKKGDLIGYSGNSGRSTGPHLHVEYIKNGIKQNPLEILKK